MKAGILDDLVGGGQTSYPITAVQARLILGLDRMVFLHLRHNIGSDLRVVAFQFGNSRVLADPSPISGGLVQRGDVLSQAIAKKTGRYQAQRFHLGQAPLRGLVPARFLCCRILLHSDDAFDLRFHQGGKGVGGNQACKEDRLLLP